jgi:hypothetical protein
LPRLAFDAIFASFQLILFLRFSLMRRHYAIDYCYADMSRRRRQLSFQLFFRLPPPTAFAAASAMPRRLSRLAFAADYAARRAMPMISIAPPFSRRRR